MRLLIDANLSHRIADRLRESGHDAVHVRDVGLRTASDPEIFEFAVSDDRVIITADADFAMMLAARRAVKPSVVQLRSADHLTPDAQATLLISNLDRMAEALATGAVASLSSRHLRMRSLPTRT